MVTTREQASPPGPRRVAVPGAPCRERVHLAMLGEIRLRGWQPFTAGQVIRPDGFVWAAQVGRRPLRIAARLF